MNCEIHKVSQVQCQRTSSNASSEPQRRRFTTVHDRFEVGCDCCGRVSGHAKKADAVRAMIGHMDRHELTETLTFSVYDLMGKTRNKYVYGGRIHNGVRSHGLGVAKSATKVTTTLPGVASGPKFGGSAGNREE